MKISTITRLPFKDAFSGIRKFDLINADKDYFNELFDYSNRAIIFVYDDTSKGYSVFIKNTIGLGRDKTLVVRNQKKKNVFLMRIDGILFKKDSKCDCSLLTDKDFVFVEFKSNASNKTEDAQIDNYENCYKQLYLTFNEFKKRFKKIGVDFVSLFSSVSACTVFNPTVPYNNSTEKTLSRRFLKKTGIKLRYTNEIEIK